jgi:broad-specificity NMP kinase
LKLVFIYGPPAVGKLTVAKELSKLTGYRILHNHLAIDLVESVFDRDNKKFWELIDVYRRHLIEAAASEKLDGVIMTSVNIKGIDDDFVKSLANIMDTNSGNMHFVQLSCEMTELEKRLGEPSRKQHGKLNDTAMFRDFISKNQVFHSIDFVSSLKIDNTDLTPEETAKKIAEHYGL